MLPANTDHQWPLCRVYHITTLHPTERATPWRRGQCLGSPFESWAAPTTTTRSSKTLLYALFYYVGGWGVSNTIRQPHPTNSQPPTKHTKFRRYLYNVCIKVILAVALVHLKELKTIKFFLHWYWRITNTLSVLANYEKVEFLLSKVHSICPQIKQPTKYIIVSVSIF